jgi:hypothetical protein
MFALTRRDGQALAAHGLSFGRIGSRTKSARLIMVTEDRRLDGIGGNDGMPHLASTELQAAKLDRQALLVERHGADQSSKKYSD